MRKLKIIPITNDNVKRIVESSDSLKYTGGHEHIIFSHDFAKAFWGEYKHDGYEYETDGYCYNCRETVDDYQSPEYCWQYHLQQLVLEKDPIKYLEKFI